MYTAAPQTQVETKNPRVNLLVSKWQQVWLLALDRRRKLNDSLDRLEEVSYPHSLDLLIQSNLEYTVCINLISMCDPWFKF